MNVKKNLVNDIPFFNTEIILPVRYAVLLWVDI